MVQKGQKNQKTYKIENIMHKSPTCSEKNSTYSFLHSQNSQLIDRFVNFLTKKGKKSKAQNILYSSLKILSTLSKNDSLKLNKNLSSSRSINTSSNQNLAIQSSVKNSHDTEIDVKIFALFYAAIINCQPLFEIKKVRIAGTTYQVPSLMSQNRQENIAINWLIESTFSRKKKAPSQNFDYCLALEIYDAFLKQGYARQKRNDLHKLAESNRAFAHFRWW